MTNRLSDEDVERIAAAVYAKLHPQMYQCHCGAVTVGAASRCVGCGEEIPPKVEFTEMV